MDIEQFAIKIVILSVGVCPTPLLKVKMKLTIRKWRLNLKLQIKRGSVFSALHTRVLTLFTLVYSVVEQDPYLPLDNINRYITCGFCNKVGLL